jgi:cell division protein FtsI (penicillin-binding protein 3)
MRTRRSRARISIAVVMVFAVVGIFLVRLVDIQLVQADELNAEAHDKRAQSLVTYGVRGSIVDANGAVLADSVERYDITASPRNAFDRENATAVVTEALGRIAAITGQDPAALMAALMADPAADFAYLAQGVNLEVFHAVRDLNVPWVYFELRPSRTYPNGAIAGNLVGFRNEGPGAGLEITEDGCLAATNGEATYEKAEDGTMLPGSLVTETKPKNGGTLRLTIDRDLQWYVQQRMIQTVQKLGATWATAVVIRIRDGHLMAVADYPSIDPNNLDGAPPNAFGSLAFSTPYEPGSTVKALTAASLIDAGVATPASEVVSPYALTLEDGGVITDALYHGDENLTLAGALVESSNTAIAQFATWLPAQQRHDYLTAFGFNDYTEVGFNGESSGLVHPADEWDVRTNRTVQFGQGLQVTSVQVASAYQTLGNGGVRMPVTLVEGCEWPDGTVTDLPPSEGRRVVSESAADQTIAMMEMVATSSSSAPNLQIPGYRIAVKSGTAQVAEDGGYARDKAVLSYAGVAPAEDPQYAVVVTAGVPANILSGVMAPTFRDVMAHTLTTFRVAPSAEPGPNLPLRW